MDIRRLEVFCKVVELKSFSKAAEALLLAQPTVSEHLRILEDMVEERLVDRTGREIVPTAAGRLFYPYARDIIQLRAEALQALKQFRGELAGDLMLGASTIPGTYLLPRVIGEFKIRHPATRIYLRIADTAAVVHDLLEGHIEAGLVGSRWSERQLVIEEIGADELILTVPPDHPWAERGTVGIHDLATQPFVLRERGSGTRMVMTRILEEHGFDVTRLQAVAEMGSTEAVRQAVKARVGVSILSRQAVEEDLHAGTLVEISVAKIRFRRPLFLVQRKHRQPSPLCSAFLAHLRDATRSSVAGGP